ncbi:hypothetical protein PR048_017781 [Dryococelus australis]|uniref:Uncharacterized protein n=1 Tax=Dryococelus australis TaxID=614101 RepID=A0ABQ9HAJ9_9NEOP|nr:hypothetical protein PR048_017781 [Dryococelus australis]
MEINLNSECVNVNKKHTKDVKRKVDTSNWQEEDAKIKTNSGEGYVSRSGKAIPGKRFAPVTRCCTSEYFNMFSAKQQNAIFTEFWSIGDEQKQDTLLVSFVENKEVMRIRVDEKTHNTCKNFVLQNLQVSELRIKTVLREVNLGNVSPQENMGSSKIGNYTWEMVTEYWDTFPSKNSHYGRSKSERKYFDGPTLNVIKMHKSFQHFRLPRTDVCDFFWESKHILNNNPCDSRKVDYEIHKIKTFLSIRDSCGCMYSTFNATTMTQAHFTAFLENEGQKNPNSVCSFIYNFIKKNKQERTKNILKMGQNKNTTVVKFCAWLSKLLSVNIMHIFPNDRNLGLYGQVLKKIECIEHPDQYLKVMAECRSNPDPLKTTAKKKPFRIQKCVILKYMPGSFVASELYSAVFQPYNLKGKGCEEMFCNKHDLNLLKASRPTLKSTKIQDVLSFKIFWTTFGWTMSIMKMMFSVNARKWMIKRLSPCDAGRYGRLQELDVPTAIAHHSITASGFISRWDKPTIFPQSLHVTGCSHSGNVADIDVVWRFSRRSPVSFPAFVPPPLHPHLICSTDWDDSYIPGKYRYVRVGETGDPREIPPTSHSIRYDSRIQNQGVTRPGIEPGSPRSFYRRSNVKSSRRVALARSHEGRGRLRWRLCARPGSRGVVTELRADRGVNLSWPVCVCVCVRRVTVVTRTGAKYVTLARNCSQQYVS